MTRINDRIRAPRVRVIDGETHKQLGVMQTQDAVRIAKQRGLDLVEVTANTDPPVCKIVEYGKFKYEQSKQKKERNKSKAATRVKEVKFHVRTDQHDYVIKLRHAEEFLMHGHKLRLQLQFRGREMAHQELGLELMERVKGDLHGMGHVDMEPKKTGRQVVMMMSPLPKEKQKPKFYTPQRHDEDGEEEPGEGGEHEESGEAPAPATSGAAVSGGAA
jgi:translation initiation factor IF-3